MDGKIVIIGFIMLLGIHCNTLEYKPIETKVAKAILLNRMVQQSDNLFERRTKSLVANFLVNTAITTRQSESLTQTAEEPTVGPEEYDYGNILTEIEYSTTTQRVFTWPPLFNNKVITNTPIAAETEVEEEYAPIIQPISNLNTKSTVPEEEDSSTANILSSNTTAATTTESEPIIAYVEKPGQPTRKPARRPGGLIGSIQYLTLIVPDALRPGRNTTSLLNKQSISSILKIIGSVAFLNLTGVIDNSVSLGTSPPVRELVDGITNLVFCNQFVQGLSAGRCHRRLFEDESLDFKAFMDQLHA